MSLKKDFPRAEYNLGPLATKITQIPIEDPVGAPSNLVIYQAILEDAPTKSGSLHDGVGAGAGFDAERTWLSAIGEAVERYCGNRISCIDRTATTQELAKEDADFISPAEEVQFLPSQLEHPNFPFDTFSENAQIEWVSGEPLCTKSNPMLIPASMVYLEEYERSAAFQGLPIFHLPVVSGLAAGATEEAAITASLLEVVERDTVALWWLGRRETQELIVDENSETGKLVWNGVDQRKLRLKWMLLPSDFRLPTVVCAAVDHANRIVTTGFATRFSVAEAVLKATAEAFQLRLLSRMILVSDSPVWREWGPGLLKPYREDRAYLDSYRADSSDMIELEHNAQILLDSRAWSKAMRRLHARSRISLEQAAAETEVTSSDALIREFSRLRMRTYTVDLTTEKISQAGLCVMRTVVPEACRVTPTAFPLLANRRLQQVLSREKRTLVEEQFDLNPIPMC